MTFIKDDTYTDVVKNCFEYFENHFKTERADCQPSDFKYYLRDIPHTYFKAIDVHYPNNKFFRRYLIIIVQNGDTQKLTPESYSDYLGEHLCNLPNPVGGFYPQGIALMIADNCMTISELALQKQMVSVNCGS